MASPLYAADPPPDPTPHPCTLKPDDQIRIDYAVKYGPCPAGLDDFEKIVANVISVMVGLGIIAMLAMLVMTGIKYITSGGEPKAIQSANYTLTWALLGFLFFALVWIVLQLVESFTGLKLTTFDIKTLCEFGGKNWCTPS